MSGEIKTLDAATLRQLECLMAQIAMVAVTIDGECRYDPPDEFAAELLRNRMRHAFRQVGWMADLAVLKMGGSDVARANSEATAAVDWLMPPSYSDAGATAEVGWRSARSSNP